MFIESERKWVSDHYVRRYQFIKPINGNRVNNKEKD